MAKGDRNKRLNYQLGISIYGENTFLSDARVELEFLGKPLLIGTHISFGHYLITVPGSYPVNINATLRVKSIGYKQFITTEWIDGKSRELVAVKLSRDIISNRRGITRAEGNRILDDNGYYFGLGHTNFTALDLWANERDRCREHLSFYSRLGCNYTRVIACLQRVEEDGTARYIDPYSDRYQYLLADYLDTAWKEYGLQTELTLIGGFAGRDPVTVANIIAPVLKDRNELIFNSEMVNEWTLNHEGITLDTMKQMADIIRAVCPQNIVMLSDAEGFTLEQLRSGILLSESANAMSVHLDRGFGDDGWKSCRQPWDWRDLQFVISSNEPIGPRSSVSEETDPLRLAMLRATCIISGINSFVFHNGNCVANYPAPSRNRGANAWDVPNVEDMMRAVANVTKFMTVPLSGRYWNNQWAGNPCPASNIWPNDGFGVNRQYMIEDDHGFWSVLNGIYGRFDLIPDRPMSIDFYNPVTDITITKTSAGEHIVIDEAELGKAAICHGVYL